MEGCYLRSRLDYAAGVVFMYVMSIWVVVCKVGDCGAEILGGLAWPNLYKLSIGIFMLIS